MKRSEMKNSALLAMVLMVETLFVWSGAFAAEPEVLYEGGGWTITAVPKDGAEDPAPARGDEFTDGPKPKIIMYSAFAGGTAGAHEADGSVSGFSTPAFFAAS